MSSDIEQLPAEVINLIAAGEVIDSLAAVVRELVENSLDAGANRIAISVCPELWRLQVADNGRGMCLPDLRLCTQAHSTSKIRSCSDLWKITSLGFRGEALHSLTQLADLEILSRTSLDRNASGWRLTYSQGETIEVETVAIAPGTIVKVSNLFGNVPVRRKGLPSMSQQLKAVQDTIEQFALCHPHVTWQVEQNERLWFKISPGTNTQQILPQILKSVHQEDLQWLTLDVDTSELTIPPPLTPLDNGREFKSKIELVLGLPDRCHRRRPDWVRVAVNGRVVRSLQLEQTIMSALARTLPRDRYPVCFLHLHICPSQIDWNRHPAKTEIYLHSLKFWQEQVSQAMEKALLLSPVNLPSAVHNNRVGQLLKAAESPKSYQINSSSQPSQNQVTEVGLMELRAVAQVRNTYIVAEHPSGLWLVEQHIAHERVLYEQLEDNWQLVTLETPLILNQLTTTQLEQLQRLGLEIDPFGEQLWAVRSAPKMLHQRKDCTDALIELSWGGDLQEAQVATACRSAIRNGTSLNLSQMQSLLDEWKQTRNPRTCPHGRPIYLSLEESSLARFFRRHWVIGKSHGI